MNRIVNKLSWNCFCLANKLYRHQETLNIKYYRRHKESGKQSKSKRKSGSKAKDEISVSKVFFVLYRLWCLDVMGSNLWYKFFCLPNKIAFGCFFTTAAFSYCCKHNNKMWETALYLVYMPLCIFICLLGAYSFVFVVCLARGYSDTRELGTQ